MEVQCIKVQGFYKRLEEIEKRQVKRFRKARRVTGSISSRIFIKKARVKMTRQSIIYEKSRIVVTDEKLLKD